MQGFSKKKISFYVFFLIFVCDYGFFCIFASVILIRHTEHEK